MSVVLEKQPNGNYEPSESEINEYGKWLGMRLPEDDAFLWIAREGLKAPLPEHWKACKSEKGELYYFNFKTGQSIWDHPMDEHFKELFKSEKLNPTPQSLASGAKRKGVLSTPSKAAKSADGENDEAVATVVGMRKAQETNSHSKSSGLKSVKLKKELPDALKINFGACEPVKPKPLKSEDSPVKQTGAMKSDSTPDEVLCSTDSKGTDGPSSAGAGGGRVAAGGGLNGLKALAKLNTPSSRSKMASEEEFEQGKKRITEEIQLRLSNFRKEKDEELEAEKNALEEKLHATLKRFKQEMEQKKQHQKEECERMLEEGLQKERSQFESQLSSSIGKLREELSAQKSVEMARVRSTFQERLDSETKKIEHEAAEALESFTREKRRECEIKKEAQLQALKEVGLDLTEFKQWSVSVLRQYEEAYTVFASALEESRRATLMRNAQCAEELQKELDENLRVLKEGHLSQIKAEECSLKKELEKMREEHAGRLGAMHTSHATEARKIEHELTSAEMVDEKAQAAVQKETFIEMMNALREAQMQEIENIKDELKKRAEEELRTAVEDLAKEQRDLLMSRSPIPEDNGITLNSQCPVDRGAATNSQSKRPEGDSGDRGVRHVHSEPGPRMNDHEAMGYEKRAHPPSLGGDMLQQKRTDIYHHTYPASSCNQRDIKAAITEVLHEVFAGSPFTLASPAHDKSLGPLAAIPPQNGTMERGAKKPSSIGDAGTHSFSFPVSFQDQRALIEREHRRLSDGRRFVDNQKRYLEERRQDLRRTRHQWKEDVMAAKEEGLRSSSERGRLLNKIRISLEEQSRGLENDEAILRDSENWLHTKEQRLQKLEHQVEEQERLRGQGDSLANCSIDTAALVTGFFKPQVSSSSSFLHDERGKMRLWNFKPSDGSSGPLDRTSTHPVLSKALSRIERRLDEVTSIISMQQRAGTAMAHTANGGHGLPEHSSTAAQVSRSRQRGSRSQPKTVEFVSTKKAVHIDPWQRS